MGGRADVDCVGTSSGAGNRFERVVTGDRQRTVAALVQSDVGVGNAAALKSLGRPAGQTDGAGAGDGEVGGGGGVPSSCSC